MREDHVDIVRVGKSEDHVFFMGPQTTAALGVLLHLMDEDPHSTLSPYLVALMKVMDRKIVKYTGRKADAKG